MIFSIQPDLKRMKSFMEQIRATATEQGCAHAPRVTFAIQPFVADSEREAIERKDAMLRRIPIDAALTRMSGTFGVDLSTVDIKYSARQSRSPTLWRKSGARLIATASTLRRRSYLGGTRILLTGWFRSSRSAVFFAGNTGRRPCEET